MENQINSRELSRQLNRLSKSFGDEMGKALEAGISNPKTFRDFERKFVEAQNKIVEARKESKKIEKEIQKEQEESQKLRLMELLRAQREIATLEAKRFKKELEHVNRIIERRENATAKGFAEATNAFTQKFESMVNSMLSGDFGSMSNATKDLVENLTSVNAQLAKMGLILGSFIGLGAVIGKIFLDSDSQVKNFNRSLLESGASMADLARYSYEAEDSLKLVRKASFDISNNMRWGVMAQDQAKIIGSYIQMGINLDKIVGKYKDVNQQVQKLQEYTSVALTYSRILGKGSEDMAQSIGSYMEDLGLSLEGVNQKFGQIFEASIQSGFGVKRFFGQVLQATSGMSMYNVRLDEAAGLLLRLSKTLGIEGGGNFLQGLQKGFADESMTDRYKRILIAGQSTTAKVFKDQAQIMAQEFLEGLGGREGLLEKAGLSTKGAGDLLSSLRKMSTQEQAQAVLTVRGTDPTLSRQLEKLVTISESTKGGLTDLAMGMSQLSQGGKLAMQLSVAQSRFGQPLYKLNSLQLAAFESFAGVSGEQLEILRRVSRDIDASWVALKDSKETMVSLAKDDYEKYLEASKEQVRQFGAYVTEDGKIVRAELQKIADGQEYIAQTSERAIESAQQFVMTSGDSLAEKMEAPMEAAQSFAETTARATTEMSSYLKMATENWLKGIYETVHRIYSWLFDNDSGQARANMLNEQMKLLEELGEKRIELGGQMSDVRHAVRTAQTPEEKSEAIKLLTTLETQQKSIDASIKAQRSYISNLQGVDIDKIDKELGRRWGGFDTTTPEELIQQAALGKVDIPSIIEMAPESMLKPLAELADKRLQMTVFPTRKNLKMIAEDYPEVLQDALPKIMEAVAKETEATQEETRKHLEGKGGKKLAKMIAEEQIKQEKMERAKELLSSVGLEGGKRMDLYASMLASGKMGPQLRKFLEEGYTTAEGMQTTRADYLSRREGIGDFAPMLSSLRKQNDFLMRIDGQTGQVMSLVEHDRNDRLAVVGMKQGGAVTRSGGGGGGGNIIHQHFYQDGKANFHQVKKVLAALN